MTSPSLDVLWGSTITGMTFHIEQMELVFEVAVIHGSKKTVVELRMSGITVFKIETEQPGVSWDYTELTGIDVREGGDGRREVTIELWSGAAWAEIVCGQVKLDGEDLRP